MKAKRKKAQGSALLKPGSAGAERYCELMLAQGYLTVNRAHDCKGMNNAMNTDDTEKKQSRLKGIDREIAVRAIVALARGTPVEAAYQILAGIEALDVGPEAPLVALWPKERFGTTEERAAWHVAEKDRLVWLAGSFDRAREHARRVKEASSSASAPADPHESSANPNHPASQECSAHQQSPAEATAEGASAQLAPLSVSASNLGETFSQHVQPHSQTFAVRQSAASSVEESAHKSGFSEPHPDAGTESR